MNYFLSKNLFFFLNILRKLIEKKLNRFIQLIPTTNHILKMNCEEYLNQKTELQNKILDFIDCETGSDEKFQDLIKLISDSKIQADKNEFTILLNIILSIANNHHRGPNFFDKIEKILDYLKESITKYYSNYLIFDLFKRNKRILLYLFNAKIITMDKSIFKTISSDEKCQKAKYIEYFYVQLYMTKESKKKIFKILWKKEKLVKTINLFVN